MNEFTWRGKTFKKAPQPGKHYQIYNAHWSGGSAVAKLPRHSNPEHDYWKGKIDLNKKGIFIRLQGKGDTAQAALDDAWAKFGLYLAAEWLAPVSPGEPVV